MKNFEELNHAELLVLTQEQVEAYCDIAVAQAGLTKKPQTTVELPAYLRNIGEFVPPERDVTLYEVGGKCFANIEDANAFAEILSRFSDKEVKTNYEWSIGSEYKHVDGIGSYSKESIQTVSVYSKEKFQAVRSTLEDLKIRKDAVKKQEEEKVDSVIDFAAVESVERGIKMRVREALNLEDRAENIASSYKKYFQITGDVEKTFDTLYMVFGVTDEFLRTLVREKVQYSLL